MKLKRFLTKMIPTLTAGFLFMAVILTGGTGGIPAASAANGTPVYQSSDLFTDRDLSQTADPDGAVTCTVSDGQDVRITEAGIYVLSGTASGATVYVEAAEDAKVQLVLQDLHLTNADFPCIYIVSADKVFVTTAGASSLAVTGTFRDDESTHTDGAIFSRTDLVMNGTAELAIESTDNGVVSKDDLKITGGTYQVTAGTKAFEANDSIRILGGTFSVRAGTDGFHAENSEDNSKGYIYIGGGSINITCGDDGLHAVTVVQIDDGTLEISAAEGIEGTFVQINGGTIGITASDDGINAGRKSSSVETAVEFNGGNVNVTMGGGDTDGIDSNGNLYVNGGVISVTGNSTFDYDGTASYTGGTIYVNGQQASSIPNQMMGVRERDWGRVRERNRNRTRRRMGRPGRPRRPGRPLTTPERREEPWHRKRAASSM